MLFEDGSSNPDFVAALERSRRREYIHGGSFESLENHDFPRIKKVLRSRSYAKRRDMTKP